CGTVIISAIPCIAKKIPRSILPSTLMIGPIVEFPLLNVNWCSMGFIAIELMNMWDGHAFCQMLHLDPGLLRKWLMI
ncbi:unnamed protein product, partial [Urochloa humidicola]